MLFGIVAPGEPVDFYTVVESARRRGQIAFGYRLLSQADDPEKNYGVAMNPDKADNVIFSADDTLIRRYGQLADQFASLLRNGVVLCRYIQLVSPGSIKRFNNVPPMRSFTT